MDKIALLIPAALAVGVIAWLVRGTDIPRRRATDAATIAAVVLMHQLSYEREDPALCTRFAFAPFGRGTERSATHVVSGSIGGQKFTSFRYSFSKDADAPRRSTFQVTFVSLQRALAPLRLTRVSGAHAEDAQFSSNWRVEAASDGEALVTPSVQDRLMAADWPRRAVIVDGRELVVIERGESDLSELDDDVVALRDLASLLVAA